MRAAAFDDMPIEDYVALRKKVADYVFHRIIKNETDLPTFAQIGKRFSLTMQQVNQVCEDCEGGQDRGLNVNIGTQIQGVGYATNESLSENTVESDEAYEVIDVRKSKKDEQWRKRKAFLEKKAADLAENMKIGSAIDGVDAKVAEAVAQQLLAGEDTAAKGFTANLAKKITDDALHEGYKVLDKKTQRLEKMIAGEKSRLVRVLRREVPKLAAILKKEQRICQTSTSA